MSSYNHELTQMAQNITLLEEGVHHLKQINQELQESNTELNNRVQELERENIKLRSQVRTSNQTKSGWSFF